MKTIIFSDLHANLFGLNKIIDFSRSEKIDRLYCLGDVVGYHSYPSQCIEILQTYKIPTIKGNHEALLLRELDGFDKISVRAGHSLTQTRNLLSPEEISYLTQLPFSLTLNSRIHLVHANYDNLTRTINTIEKAKETFQHTIPQHIFLTFLGHTHRPGAYISDETMQEIIQADLRQPLFLKEDKYYIINPGSAGESRHNLPLSFIVYDDEKRNIKLEVIYLTAAESAELRQHNHKIFGPLSVKQKTTLAKEKLRRFYYTALKRFSKRHV